MIHVNADLTASDFCKEGWQAPLNVCKVLQTGLFRHFCLLRVSIIMQLQD
jgi:hypothetical protein